MTDVDPIVVAGDGGEILDESGDGAIECVADGDGGMTVHVDRSTEIGAQIDWIAGHQGQTAEALVAEAIEEFIERERQQRATLDEFGIVRTDESGDGGGGA